VNTNAGDGHKVGSWATYRRLLGYTRRHWPIAVLAVIGMIVDASALTGFTSLIKPMLDNLFTARDPHTIFWMPFWIVGIFSLRGLGAFMENYGTSLIGLNVVQQMRMDIFDAYLRMPSSFFNRESSGHQIARVTYTCEQVSNASTQAVKVAITDGLTVIGMVGLMLWTSAFLTLALLIMVPVVTIVVTYISRRYRRIGKKVQNVMGRVTGSVDEVVNGQREVKIYGAQRNERDRFEDVTQTARRLNMKVAITSSLSSATVQTVAAGSLALIIFMATRKPIIDTLTPGSFTTMLIAMGAILPSLKRLTGVQAGIQRGVAAAEELFEIMDMPPEADTGSQNISRCQGEIRYTDVHMRYPGAHVPALRGIDLHCKPGTVTALVGRSGSGKSTLVSMLPRFYEPSAGHIELDGRPLDDFTLAALRRQIAWVGQRVVLFNDTVANNIAYGELAGASEQETIAAAEAANAMEFIRELPNGLHTVIGQGGNQLSGGQRQRIAIARAVLKNAPILILDEATSALDTESERLIQQALNRLMRDRTTLVIAHRLSTIEHAHQIAVLDQGRVIEQGTHEQLLARGGTYAALHRMQFHDHDSALTGTD